MFLFTHRDTNLDLSLESARRALDENNLDELRSYLADAARATRRARSAHPGNKDRGNP